MMQNNLCHSLKQLPKLGTLAYWSMFANSGSDCVSEIRKRVLK